MPFIDLHAHFPMHHEIPDDLGQKILFDSLNSTINYEDLQPRVSLKRWFDDKSENAVTGFGSVLYDPQDDFFAVPDKPRPKAFQHITDQLDRVVKEITDDKRVKIARNPNDVDTFLKDRQKFIFQRSKAGFRCRAIRRMSISWRISVSR